VSDELHAHLTPGVEKLLLHRSFLPVELLRLPLLFLPVHLELHRRLPPLLSCQRLGGTDLVEGLINGLLGGRDASKGGLKVLVQGTRIAAGG